MGKVPGSLGVLAALAAAACAANTYVPEPDPDSGVFRGEMFSASVAPPPVSGGTLAVIPAPQSTAWVVAAIPEADTVHVFRVTDKAVLVRRDVTLRRGDEPGRVVGDSSQRAHVALRGSGDLVTIDLETGSIVSRRPACAAPRGLAWDPAIDAVHVACATGELVTLPAAGGPAIRRVVLDRDLRDVVVVEERDELPRAAAHASSLLVTRFRSAELLRIDASGAVAARFSAPGSKTRQAHVAWRMTPTTDGAVLSYQMERTTPVDLTPANQGSAPYGSNAGTLDTDDPNGPIVQPVFVAADRDGIHGDPQPLLFGSSPSVDVAVASNGMVAVAAGNMVTVADHGPPLQRFGEPWELPASYRQVTAVAFVELAGRKIIASLWRGGPPGYETGLVFFAAPTNDARDYNQGVPRFVYLPGAADTGLDMFQTPTKAGIACASCHPEGGDDGHTWTFRTASGSTPDGTSSVRTQSLRGGILATAPFHWEGDMPGMRAICDNVFSERMGGDHVGDAQLPILERFLDSIPRLPSKAGLDEARIARGSALFAGKGGCSSCHAGAHFTNPVNADVGKGIALQVPQLVGIGDRAPFMHDGCAPTLMDRFDPSCGGNRHGNQGLTGDEKRDLVEYLESL
jgi:hypothetical protein